jgi:tetratricopeptide (TPR) repeat protein
MRLPLFFISLLLLLPAVASAQQASGSASLPPAAIKNPAPAGDFSTEPYLFELLQHDIRFEADGKGEHNLTLRARVQSESAVRELGLLVYPFASSFESLDILYVRVRKPDGTVVETPPTDVQELDSAVSREAPMYTDQREKHIAVRSLAIGDVLEAHLRWIYHDPIAPGHFWFDHSYFRDAICLQEVIRIDVPVIVPVNIRNSEPQPEIREDAGRRVYTFRTSNLKKREESKIPDWEKNYRGAPPPDVQLTSFSSWEEVGKWYDSLEKVKTIVTPEIRAKADELTKGKVTDEEKTRAIYDFVSNRFRYIGVDLGVGRYSPHSAAEVLINRYGDCKDKHTLFSALLKSIGIKSFPVLISSKFQIDPELPTMSLFDHVITAIPNGASYQFLDTTPEVAPFGFLVRTIRDRNSLVVPDSGAARLAKTPADPPFPSYEIMKIDSSIDEHGTLDAKMRLEDRGDAELLIRLAYRATPQNRWQELTQNIVARMGFGGTVSDVSVAPPENTATPFWISFSYHRTDYPDWNDHRVTLLAPPIFMADLNEEQKASKDPLPLGAFQEVTYDSTMKFPKGFKPILPERAQEKADFAEYSATYNIDNGQLHGIIHFKTLLHEVPGAERSRFSRFAKNIDENGRRYIFVSSDSGVLLGTRGPLNLLPPSQPTIPELEKRLEDYPDNQLLLTTLSTAYCKAGRAPDAVSILEKALAENPADPSRLHFALGNAYLALPNADKAIVQYKMALGDDPEFESLNDVAYSLADANVRVDDALGFSTRAVSALSEKTMDISAKDADLSDFRLMPQLAANWDTLGWIKFRLGDFAGAEKYLAAAWDLMQTAVTGEHLVEVYEKLGNKQRAATIANMAQASFLAHAGSSESALGVHLKQEYDRLRPFLKGPGPHSEVPNGHVALTDIRVKNITITKKIKEEVATAELLIAFTNGPKVDDVVFVSGSEELRSVLPTVQAFKYPQSFPDTTPARIIRKAKLNCSKYSQICSLLISTVEDASAPVRANVPINFTTLPKD